MSKSPDAFRTISEVADWLGVQAHVLRFWESKFSQVKPVKRAGGRRYYRPADMLLLGGIKKLLHDDGLTIKGVQKMIREQGVAQVSDLSQMLDETSLNVAAGDIEQTATIVRFKDRSVTPEPEYPPVAEPAEPAQISLQLDPDTAPDPEPIAVEPVQPEPAEDPSHLPAFLHRPLTPAEPEVAEASEEPEPRPEPQPEPEPEVKTAEPAMMQRDVADPPQADALPYAPGPLARLARIDSLPPDLAREIAPLVQQLRQWHDQTAKMGTG